MNGINGINNAGSSSHHNSSISSTIDGLRNNDQILIMNLKRELDAALKQLSIKENEISTLKRCQKVTKHKELEVRLWNHIYKFWNRKREKHINWNASGYQRLFETSMFKISFSGFLRKDTQEMRIAFKTLNMALLIVSLHFIWRFWCWRIIRSRTTIFDLNELTAWLFKATTWSFSRAYTQLFVAAFKQHHVNSHCSFYWKRNLELHLQSKCWQEKRGSNEPISGDLGSSIAIARNGWWSRETRARKLQP